MRIYYEVVVHDNSLRLFGGTHSLRTARKFLAQAEHDAHPALIVNEVFQREKVDLGKWPHTITVTALLGGDLKPVSEQPNPN